MAAAGPGADDLQGLYEEVSRRGFLKQPGSDLQQMGHEMRARGLVKDPTQGGLETAAPAVPPPQPASAPRAAGGLPPVLPPTGGAGAAPVANAAMPSPAASLSRSPAPPPAKPTPARAEKPLSRGAPTLEDQQRMVEATFGTDVAPLGPVSGKLPAAGRAVSYPSAPEEERLRRADRGIDTLPALFHRPGYHAAEGGPVEGLRQNQRVATAALGRALPGLLTRWAADDTAIQERAKSLAAYAESNDGKMDAGQLAAYHRSLAGLEADKAKVEARRRQLLGYQQRVEGLRARFSETPLHSGPLLPDEVRGRAPGTWAQMGQNIAASAPGQMVAGFLPGQLTAEGFRELPKARAALMLKGEYPALPDNPGKNPAERDRYSQQTVALRRQFFTDFSGIGLRPNGAVGTPAWKAQMHRDMGKLTAWQQRLVPVFEAQVLAERKASDMARLSERGTADIGLLAASAFLGGKAHETLGPIASRLLQPLESRLVGQGLGAASARFALHQIPRLAGGAAGGGVAGALFGGGAAGLGGGGAREITRGALTGAGAGARLGALFAGVAAAPDLWRLSKEQFGTRWDPERSPAQVEAMTAAARRVYGLSETETQAVRERLTRIGKTPAAAKGRMLDALRTNLEQAKTPKVGARPVEPEAPPSTPESRMTTHSGASVALSHMTPEAVEAQGQAAMARGDVEAATAAQLHLARHGAHEVHAGRVVPHELAGEYAQELTAPGNTAMTGARAVRALAGKVKGDDPDLAEKLHDAAEGIERNFQRDFLHRKAPLPPDWGEPAPPVTVSPWRRMTPEQQASLPAGVQSSLLVQDISRSNEVRNPGAKPILSVKEVPGRARSVETLRAIADEQHSLAEREAARVPAKRAVEASVIPASPPAMVEVPPPSEPVAGGVKLTPFAREWAAGPGAKTPLERAAAIIQAQDARWINDPQSVMDPTGKGELAAAKIDTKIGRRFDAHGLRPGQNELAELDALLSSGLRQGEPFHTTDLGSTAAGTAGLGGNAKSRGGIFTVIGPPDGTIAKHGIRGVLVEDLYQDVIPILQERYPNVRFGRASAANEFLANALAGEKAPAAPLPPPARAPAPARPSTREPHEMTQKEFVQKHGHPEDMLGGMGMAQVAAQGKPGIAIEPAGAGERAVVFRDEKGVARGTLQFSSAGEALGVGKVASIEGLYVDPGARRLGIATKLHEALEGAGYTPQALPERFMSEEGAKVFHARAVRRAVAEGKAVPDEVKGQYSTVTAPDVQALHAAGGEALSGPLSEAVSEALAKAGLGETLHAVGAGEHVGVGKIDLPQRLAAAEEYLAAHEVTVTDTDGVAHVAPGMEIEHEIGSGQSARGAREPGAGITRGGEVRAGGEGRGEKAAGGRVGENRGEVRAGPERAGEPGAGKPGGGARGGTTRVRAGEQTVAARWAAVEIGDLLTSHAENLTPTEGYPQELQPRDRSRLASREQIADLANRLDPELMAENPLAQHGAPIVGSDRAVESGNARTIALRQAYRTGGKAATAYQKWLRNHAGRFGIKPEAVARLSQPILVRVRTTAMTPEERVRFTQAANARETAAMGGAEQAKVDANRLTPTVLAGYDPGGDLTAASNRAFMRDFIGTLPAAEHAGMRTADGGLTREGLARARNALFHHAYGDTGALVRLAEAVDDPTRQITNGLLRAAGFVGELRTKAASGAAHPLDISSDVAAAAGQLASLKEQGMSVPEYRAQQRLFGEGLDEFQQTILQSLEANKRSGKRIAALLADYVDVALKAGDPQTASLFEGIAPPTKAEVWEAAMRRLEGIARNEPGLFNEREAAAEVAGTGGGGAGAPAAGTAAEKGAGEAEAPAVKMRGARSGKIVVGPFVAGEGKEPAPEVKVYDDPALEAWRKANRGARPLPDLNQGVKARLAEGVGALRDWWERQRAVVRGVPDNPQNRPLISGLLRLAKLDKIAGQEAIFRMNDAVHALSPEGYQQFGGALLVPDMLEDLDRGVPLAPMVDAEGKEIGPEAQEKMIREEAPKLAARVEATPELKQAIETWRKGSKETATAWRQSLIDIGQPAPALDREHWWHHQVLDRLEEKARGLGASAKLKAILRPGFSRERTGGVPYNTDWIEAHQETMADMIRMTEQNKLIRLVQNPKNGFNILPQIEARRALAKDPEGLGWLQKVAVGQGAIEPFLEALPQRLGSMAAFGEGTEASPALPDDPNGRFEHVLAHLAEAQRLNEAKTPLSLRPLTPDKMATDIREWARWTLGQFSSPAGTKMSPATAVPATHAMYRFVEGHPLYRATALSAGAEKLAREVMEGVSDQLTVGKAELKKVLAVARQRGDMVLPVGVAQALEHLRAPESSEIDRAVKKVAGIAKGIAVLNPEHLPTFGREHTMGAGVRIMRATPGVFGEAPEALEDLWNTRQKGLAPATDYREWLFEGGGGGMVGGQANVAADHAIDLLRRLRTQPERTLGQKVGRALQWTPETVGKVLRAYPDRLDELTRYSAYKYFKKMILAHGEPPVIGAARRDLAMSLKTPEQQAFFLSEHLMGAYNEIPQLVKDLRDHLPGAYWGFAWAQGRSETNLFLNAFWREPEIRSSLLKAVGLEEPINRAGRGAVWGANAVAFMAKLAMVGGAIAANNHFRFGKEEKDLDDPSPWHVDVAHGPQGTVIQWSHAGILPNVASFMGLDDAWGYWQLYKNGKMTKAEIARRVSMTGPQDFLALSGVQRAPLELAMKHKLSTGGRIQDAFEYAAGQLHVPLLYEAIARPLIAKTPLKFLVSPLPRPMRGGLAGQLKATLLGGHLVDPSENAYREAGDAAREWMQTARGISPAVREQAAFTPISAAIYGYKKALQYGEKDTALKYLAAYARAGGTDKKLREQLARLEPMAFLNEDKMAEYAKTLSPAAGERLRTAYGYWQRFAAPDVDKQALAAVGREKDLASYAAGMRDLVKGELSGETKVEDWLEGHPYAASQVQSAGDKAKAQKAEWKVGARR